MALLSNILNSLSNKAKQGVRSSRNFFTKKLSDDEGLFQRGKFVTPPKIAQGARKVADSVNYAKFGADKSDIKNARGRELGEAGLDMTLRLPIRAALETGLSGLKTFTPVPNKVVYNENTLEDFLTGSQRNPLKPIQYQPEDRFSKKAASKTGLPQKMQLPLAMGLSVLGTAGDLLPAGGAKKETGEQVVKLAGQASRAVKRTDDIKDLLSKARFVTKTGGEFDIKGTPLESIFNKIPEVGTQLPAPKQVLPLKDVKKLANQGDNLQNVTVTAKNADEAREAVRLGLDPSQVEIPKKTVQGDKTFYSGDKGLSEELDQVKAMLRTSNKSSGEVKKFNRVLDSVLEPKRLLRKVLPEDMYQQADEAFLKPLNQKRGEAADFKNKYQNILKTLGSEFKKKSKFSELTHKYGEGLIDEQALISQVGTDGAAKIIEADRVFRTMYDEILDTINANRTAAGMSVIEKRNDYYRHMSEVSDNWLSSIISGGGGQKRGTSPVSSGIFQKREGEKTTYDAVGGMLNYLELAGRAGFTDTVTPNIKLLANQLYDRGDRQAGEYLSWYADQILGITKDDGTVGGVIKDVAAKMRGSRVIGNISSLVNQTASFPAGINDAGWDNFVQGMTSKTANQAYKQSAYLKDAGYRPPSDFSANIGDRVVHFAGAALQESDLVAKRMVWQGMYNKAVKQGVEDAVSWADEATEAVMGSRGIGSASQFQSSWIGQLIAPFTNEAQTQANRIIELIGEKKFLTLLGIVGTNFLFNEATERYATGNRILFDPIDASLDAYEQYVGSDKKEKSNIKAAARLIAEVISAHPVLNSSVFGAYQLAQVLDGDRGVVPDSREIFGSDDPTRFGSASLYNPLPTGRRITGIETAGLPLIDAGLEMGSKYIPFGNQAVKTLQDIFSEGEGAVSSRAGDIMYETPKNPLSRIQGLVMGQYSTPEAREYFDNDFNRPLSEEESEIYRSLPEGQRSTFLENARRREQESNRFDSQIQKTEEPTFLENIFGGGKQEVGLPAISESATAQEIKDFNSRFDKLVDLGQPVTEKDIEQRYFRKYKADSDDISDREKAYSELKNIMDNEDLPDELKQQALSASGATQEDWEFYSLAKGNVRERREELVKMVGQITDREKLIPALFELRKSVAGSSALPTTDIDYLYDKGLISKEEEQYLSNVKYDELTGEFYMDRDYDGGGGLSDSKKKALDKAVQKSLQAFIEQLNKQSTSGNGAIYDLIRALSKKSSSDSDPYASINKRLASIKLPVIKDKRV